MDVLIDLTRWTLTSATGVSADGTAIFGSGTFEGAERSWVVSGLKFSKK